MKSAYGSVENTGVNVHETWRGETRCLVGMGYFSKIVAPGPLVAIIEPGSRRQPARGRSMSVCLWAAAAGGRQERGADAETGYKHCPGFVL